MDYSALEPKLRQFLDGHFGPGHDLVSGGLLEDGHAGLTYYFSVSGPTSDELLHMVLKLAPPGVRRSGNTDVYRQALLLRALHAAGLPVPSILFASPEETEFGTPYIIMPRLPGRTFVVWAPNREFDRDEAMVASLWQQTAGALATLHRFDWRAGLGDWDKPRDTTQELRQCAGLLLKAPQPEWVSLGQQVHRRLEETMPRTGPIGLVHGDYQPGNVLFESGRLVAVIDWELASIGDQRLDLGWLLMMADGRSWPESWQPVAPRDCGNLIEIYQKKRGIAVGDMRWHQALAGYRMGAISCLNVWLHRSGKHRDGIWERFAEAVPTLFGRALELVRDLQQSRISR